MLASLYPQNQPVAESPSSREETSGDVEGEIIQLSEEETRSFEKIFILFFLRKLMSYIFLHENGLKGIPPKKIVEAVVRQYFTHNIQMELVLPKNLDKFIWWFMETHKEEIDAFIAECESMHDIPF